jgi:DNA replication and repair protein RecF
VLNRLVITNFRCIEKAEIELDSRCSIFVGPNGAGKTSVLESAHVLSCARSFRTHRLSQLIRRGVEALTVVGEISTSDRTSILGVRASADGFEARLRGEKAKGIADLARELPLYVIDPNIHRVIEDGPENRRRLLDRGLFHVEQGFVGDWRRYHRVLKQRNSILKSNGTDSEICIWEPELIETGERVAQYRRDYAAKICDRFAPLAEELLGSKVELKLHDGWSSRSLAEELERSRTRDRKLGSTSVGPHRADLIFSFAGESAKQFVSRGQQKLLAAFFVLAQVAEFGAQSGRRACLLLDDPGAELDVDNFGKLISQIEFVDAQLLITGLDVELLSKRLATSMFHVEQGCVRRLL